MSKRRLLRTATGVFGRCAGCLPTRVYSVGISAFAEVQEQSRRSLEITVYSSFAGLKKQDNCRLVRKPITRSLLLTRFPSTLPISNHLRTSCTFFLQRPTIFSRVTHTHHALHTNPPLLIHPSIAAIIPYIYIYIKTSIPRPSSAYAARFRLRKQRSSFQLPYIHTKSPPPRHSTPTAASLLPLSLSLHPHRSIDRPNSEDC